MTERFQRQRPAAKFTEGNSTPCPHCQWPIAIHYDAPECVGVECAGYYLSHVPWVPYPKWTDCPVYERVRKMPKYEASEQADAARAALKA